MADTRSYRFKVTAADGTQAQSEVFQWPPPEAEGGASAPAAGEGGAGASEAQSGGEGAAGASAAPAGSSGAGGQSGSAP